MRNIDTEVKRVISEMIRVFINQSGETISRIADKIGMSRPALSRILTGKHLPDPATILLIAKALPRANGITLAHFYANTILLAGFQEFVEVLPKGKTESSKIEKDFPKMGEYFLP